MKTINVEGKKIDYYTKNEIFQIEEIPADDLYYAAYQIADRIASQLQVPCPDIGFMPCIHQQDLATSSISEQGAKSYTTNDFPELTNNLIVISAQYPYHEILVGILAHEIRHIWQHIYVPDINQYPAQGFFQSLTHPAEIDADGYAICYISQELNITLNNAAEIICREECQHYPDDYIIRIKKATEIKDNMQSKSNKKSSAFHRFLRLRKGEN